MGREAIQASTAAQYQATPTRSELYPARKLPDLFEPRDVLVRVGDAIDRLQALLVDEPVVSHHNISVLGSIAMLPGYVASSQGVWHGTTILTVRKGGRVVIAGDGQVSLGATVIKANAKKVRSVGKGDVIGGFAGATADAFTLFERLETKLEQYPGQLTRACVELAKDWRTDRYLRRLEAMMIVADRETTLVLTGTGDVLEPERGVMGIGSGGNYALAAARALMDSRPRRRGDRPQGHGDRRRDLRLHQHQRRHRGARQQQMTSFSPREIVSELDRFIVGQKDAKRAVAIALRNRWRRQQLPDDLRDEVLPKNILMIGPTGCGKTEISRRLARLAGAPFLKVEATKFTEVGYVGRDVDSIVRDLVEVGIGLMRETQAQGGQGAGREERRGARARRAGRHQRRRRRRARRFRKQAARQRARRQGDRDPGGRDRPAVPDLRHSRAARSACSTSTRCWARRSASAPSRARITVGQAYDILIAQESDKLLDQDQMVQEAIARGRERRHRLPRRDRQDLRALARRPHRRRRLARGRAARPAAADRGHDGLDQVRAGEDRPRPVHRLGRLPRRQALRPAAGAAGPAADPRRAASR